MVKEELWNEIKIKIYYFYIIEICGENDAYL